MKKLFLISLAALLAVASQAQTNVDAVPNLIPPSITPAEKSFAQEVWNDYLLSTNSALVVAGGAKTTDFKQYILAVDYLYNFNDNAGLLIGVDDIFGGPNGTSQLSALRGGLQLKTTIEPLQVFGVTNFVATPFAAELVSTALNGANAGNVGLVTIAGADFNLYQFRWGNLHAGGMYENRTGEGWASGNYALAHLGLTLNHIKAGGKPW